MPNATDAGARLITKNRIKLTEIPPMEFEIPYVFPQFSRIKKIPEFSRFPEL